MTDKEIIKALECCTPTNESCLDCPLINVSVPECAEILYKESIDLINRQQAEIEKYKNGIKKQTEKHQLYKDNMDATWEWQIEQAKSEAIKEFAERLKENTVIVKIGKQNCRVITVDGIDYYKKEVVGDAK